MTRFLAALAILLAAPAVRADDEASERTAILIGADADKLGVSIAFVEGTLTADATRFK